MIYFYNLNPLNDELLNCVEGPTQHPHRAHPHASDTPLLHSAAELGELDFNVADLVACLLLLCRKVWGIIQAR